MKMLAITVLALLATVIGGCASNSMPPARVNLQSVQADAEAKSVMRLSDKAIVFLIRPSDSTIAFRDATPLSISINTKPLGGLAADTYLKLTLNPGQYVFNGKSGGNKPQNLRDAEWRNSFDAGKTYFVSFGVRFVPWPWPGHNEVSFEPVDEVAGRRLLSRSELARNALEDEAAVRAKQETTSRLRSEMIEKFKSYDVFSSIPFYVAYKPVDYGNYFFADIMYSAKSSIEPRLEAASLEQLKAFQLVYGEQLSSGYTDFLKNLIAAKERDAEKNSVRTKVPPSHASGPKPFQKSTMPSKSVSNSMKTQPEPRIEESPKGAVSKKSQPAPNPF